MIIQTKRSGAGGSVVSCDAILENDSSAAVLVDSQLLRG